MRVYISVDMEGIAGVNHPAPTDPTDRRYPVSVDLMVGETNAAIEGALAAGATDILGAIADEVATRFGVDRIAIVHRTGEVPLGEVSVAIVAVSPHRDAAFEAARYAIDETKARAPIWKAERFEDGHVWIGEPARTGPSNEPEERG